MFSSDVNPRSHEDVLDVERVSKRHLHYDAQHRDEQESRDAEAYRSPCFEDFLAPAGECRPWIIRGSSSDPPIETRVADHEVRPDDEQPEERGQRVVTESEQVRQIDVGQRLDQMWIPNLSGPEPVPSGAAEKCSDDDERDP